MIMDPGDAQKILDLYIHDYMMKKNLHKTAETFAREANVVLINLPDGFLMEWWALFWDGYCSRLQLNPEAAKASGNAGQNFFPMLLQPSLNQQASSSMQQNPQQTIGSMPQNPFAMFQRPELNQQTMNAMQISCPMPNPEMDQQRFAQFPVPLEFVMQQGETISTLLEKMYEQDCLRCSARDMAGSTQHPDVGTMNPNVASSSKLSFPQQQNPGDIQQWLGRDYSHRNLKRSNTVVLTPQEESQATLPSREIPDLGKNKGVQINPITAYPLGDLGLVSPALGHQVSSSLLSLVDEQQQIPTSGGHSTHDILPALAAQRRRKLVSFASGNSSCLAGKNLEDWRDAEMDKSIEEVIETYLSFGNDNADELYIPYNTLLPNSSIGDQNEAKGKNKEVQIDPVTAYPLGDLGLVSPALGHQVSNSLISLVEQQPLIPTSGGHCQQDLLPALSSASGSSGTLARENLQDWKDAKMDKSMEEVIETYLSFGNDNADEMDIPNNTLPLNSSTSDQNEAKGFSLTEVGSLHSSNTKLLCCHFSSQGRLLAAAGHEKKVLIWNMDDHSVNTIQGHSNIITDIRFSPNSTVFATSSFDKSVLFWDASKPSKSLFKLMGHNKPVMSLDFHPRKVDLLCSCDRNNEIRMWNVNNCTCAHIFQGASRQVRFQTRVGDLLATASQNIINLIDVETNSIIFQLKGHIKDVRSFCWDTSGKYIASVSEDSARIWSVNSGERCIHELQCIGNQFESCIFHPSYAQLLVIGTNKIIQLWNPVESNRPWSFDAHKNKIAALADSPQTETIATASHDQWVKLWK